MQVTVKARKIGGSIIAHIPSDAVKELGIKEGDDIRMDLEKPKKSYFGSMPRLTKFTEDDRFDRR